ncbi:MAG: hypothetical protein HZA51_07225 [Planctomycetes bacterium]|nr:hypothetical protein [Planctomycetota bacterium]
MRSRNVTSLLLAGILAVMARPSTSRAEPDAFVDELITNSGTYDIGERTAFSPIGPAIAPVVVPNAVTGGTVRGQFEFTCGTGGTPADCPDAAYAASAFNWKWGVLKVTDYSNFPTLVADFISVSGKTLFESDLVANEGFTTIETQGFDGNSFTRLAHFEFNLEGAGVTLDPGFSYIIFSVLSEFSIPDLVPGAGPGFTGLAEESIFQSSAIDGPPFQFHQAFPVFDPTGNLNQLATSRLIKVEPEPASCFLMLIGAACIARMPRRNRHL